MKRTVKTHTTDLLTDEGTVFARLTLNGFIAASVIRIELAHSRKEAPSLSFLGVARQAPKSGHYPAAVE